MTKNMLVKEDLRSRLTKSLLADSLLSCLHSMTYPEISVIRICTEAQVHRTTFYKHFETKDDLLAYAVHKKYIKPEMDVRQKNKGSSAPRDNFLNLISWQLDIFLRDKDYFYILFSTRENDPIILMLISQMATYIQEQLEHNKVATDLPPNVVAEYTAGGVMTFIHSCIRSKMPYTKEKMMLYISRLTVFY